MGDNSFKNESSVNNFEWHRERILREKKTPNSCTRNRLSWNLREISKKHGAKAARELMREYKSK